MSKAKDLTGQRFGRLLAIKATDKRKGKCVVWECQCDCGNISYVRSGDLLSGNNVSCGCRKKEWYEKGTTRKHGKINTKLYYVWLAMKNRCGNPSNPSYKNYGDRGIQVCEEWRSNFSAFEEWALDNGYDENAKYGKCTLDRIDNDKGYSPDNCRFVDMMVQVHNRRCSKK